MGDAQLMNIEESSEDLIAYDLNVHRCKSFSACLPYESIKVSIIASHHDIQVLPSFLNSGKTAKNFHQKVTPEHIYNLNLSIFIFGVLEDLFNSNYLASSSDSSFVNFTESSLSNNLN